MTLKITSTISQGLYGNIIQVLDLGTAVAKEIETSELTTAKKIKTREQMAVLNKVPNTAHKGRVSVYRKVRKAP